MATTNTMRVLLRILVCALSLVTAVAFASPQKLSAAGRGSAKSRSSSTARRGKNGVTSTARRVVRKNVKEARPDCTPCEASASRSRTLRNRTRKGRRIASIPCHPPGYVDPKVKRNLQAAERDLRRAGIKPKITSAWRSSKYQGWIYNCTSSKRCRAAHPGLYKGLPPGNSLHEAGFAVDVGGVATGPRGAKHLTPQGRKIVRIMGKHGFKWRYGLRDPVHFEADPRKHGYRNVKQAIRVNQNRCDAKLAVAKLRRSRSRRAATTKTRRQKQRIAQRERSTRRGHSARS